MSNTSRQMCFYQFQSWVFRGHVIEPNRYPSQYLWLNPPLCGLIHASNPSSPGDEYFMKMQTSCSSRCVITCYAMLRGTQHILTPNSSHIEAWSGSLWRHILTHWVSLWRHILTCRDSHRLLPGARGVDIWRAGKQMQCVQVETTINRNKKEKATIN